jgi:hypothetical protein
MWSFTIIYYSSVYSDKASLKIVKHSIIETVDFQVHLLFFCTELHYWTVEIYELIDSRII